MKKKNKKDPLFTLQKASLVDWGCQSIILKICHVPRKKKEVKVDQTDIEFSMTIPLQANTMSQHIIHFASLVILFRPLLLVSVAIFGPFVIPLLFFCFLFSFISIFLGYHIIKNKFKKVNFPSQQQQQQQ